MKKAYIVVALACVTAFSCTKNHSTYTTIDNKDTTGFVVGGVSDIQIESRDSMMVPITVEWVSGEQKKLTFSISGLPAGVTGKFAPESGYSNFTTMLTLVSKKAVLGNSSAKIMIKDEAGNTIRTYDIKLTVGPKMLCGQEVIGSYIGDYTCTADSNDSLTMSIVPTLTPSSNTVMIIGLSLQSFNVNAMLTCEGQKLTIPSQSFGTYNVSGTGDFGTDSTVTITYRVIDNSISDTSMCTAKMKKQP